MASDRQLDLLGAADPGPSERGPFAVRWARAESGKLGDAGWPGSGGSVRDDLKLLHDQHRATVLLAVGDDPSELLEAAREIGIDVRHLPSLDDAPMLERQALALANDLRAGRRAVVISRDPAKRSVPIERALAKPSEPPKITLSPRASRMAGAVLGAAIGDAMGHPTEFVRSFDAIRAEFGPNGVTGYVLFIDDGGKRVAPYTDDTQMAECVLRALLRRERDLDATMRDLAVRFVSWANDPQGGHRAPGNACLAGSKNLERGVAWHEAGGEQAGGCGSVMRAYPFGLLFADDLERAESWSVAHSKLTHRDPIALAACAAMAVGMARIVRGEPLVVVLSEMVAAACRYSPSTAAMMATAIDEAQHGISPETTLQRLQGWAAHEAIAAAMYVFARHPDDPRAAILEGANTPGDSDSIATLAGALVGARTGIDAIPSEWIRDVERGGELMALALEI